MNICLIRPPTVLRLFSITIKPTPPLGLALIAGALKTAGHNVFVIDAIAESPEQFNAFQEDIVTNGLTKREILGRIPPGTDMIGLSMMFTNNWLNDRELITYLGENLPGVTIVAGGEHISAIPEICMNQTKELDMCVLGEGEETIVELARAIKYGTGLNTIEGIAYRDMENIIVNKRRDRVKNIEDIPYPAWEKFPLETYRKYGLSYGVVNHTLSLPIIATRGCPYSCTFCSAPRMWGTRYYLRSPSDVADEMEFFIKKFGAGNFDFFDLTAIIRKEWIMNFTDEIINRKMNITWQIPAGTRAEAIDGEVAKHLRLSGCCNITYAPETGSPEILKKIKKKVVLKNMLRSIKNSHREKMNIKLNMIIGFPEEKHRNIMETMWFLVKASWCGADDIFPSVLVPYAGSELFIQLVQQGKAKPRDDEYYRNIVIGDSFFSCHFYNDNMSQLAIRMYRLLYLLVFYGTAFLFRPQRLITSIRNLLTGHPESRGELRLYEVFKRNVPGKNNRKKFIKPELSGLATAS